MITAKVNEGKVDVSMSGTGAALAAEFGVMIKSILDNSVGNDALHKAMMYTIIDAMTMHLEEKGDVGNE